jgi:hypothetical protein
MELITASLQQYEEAVKKLFPQGAYWDAQFADPQSDASRFCTAKAAAIFRFRSRMNALCNESLPSAAAEMIDDWERVLLGELFPGLPLYRRREFLCSWTPHINKREIRRIGEKHRVSVFDVTFPRSSSSFPLVHAYLEGDPLALAKSIVLKMLGGAKFGSAGCGADRLAFISDEYALHLFNEAGICLPFETEIQSTMLANQTAGFQYHVQWEDEVIPAPQPPAASSPYYNAGCLTGDLIYDAEEFALSVFLKEVLYGGNVS